MLYRVVSCIAIGFVLTCFLASVVPCMAQTPGHSAGPALTGPSNGPSENFRETEAELKQIGDEVGKEAGQLVHQGIEHPLSGGEKSHEAHGDDAHKSHGPPINKNPLEWGKDLAIWTGVVFLVVFGLLYVFAWGPITEGLDKREKGIADDIDAAKKSNAEAKELLEEYQARLDAAEEEVRSMLAQARIDAEHTGKKIVEAAQTAAEEEHQRALTEIEQATTGALSELAMKSADLAVGLAGKIVRSELKAGDHAALVTEAVSNFGKPK